MKYLFLPLGALFGFILSRAGATTYDFYAGLFLFKDLQLLWVIAVAAGVAAIGVAILKKTSAKTMIGRAAIGFSGKPYTKTLIPGSILFGVGWGLAGACPGTGLAMIGEGKLGAVFTFIGVIIGTYLFGLQKSAALKRAQIAVQETGKSLSKPQ